MPWFKSQGCLQIFLGGPSPNDFYKSDEVVHSVTSGESGKKIFRCFSSPCNSYTTKIPNIFSPLCALSPGIIFTGPMVSWKEHRPLEVVFLAFLPRTSGVDFEELSCKLCFARDPQGVGPKFGGWGLEVVDGYFRHRSIDTPTIGGLKIGIAQPFCEFWPCFPPIHTVSWFVDVPRLRRNLNFTAGWFSGTTLAKKADGICYNN